VVEICETEEEAQRVICQLRAGITWINYYHPTFNEVSWGRYKQSGIGCERGSYGDEAYTEAKQTEFVASLTGETNIAEVEVLERRDSLLSCRLEGGCDLWIKDARSEPSGGKCLFPCGQKKFAFTAPARRKGRTSSPAGSAARFSGGRWMT